MDVLLVLESPSKYDFSLWPLTLNVPFSGCMTSTPQYGNTCVTVNSLDHLDLSFSGNN